MSRLTGKGAGSLADAYASIYEGYGKKKEEKKGGDCTAASEKSKHNCAKKVCHEQFGEGTCVHGQHSFPDENGFVSHYDVEFSHGIEQAVPVSEMKVLEEGSHNEEAHEGMYDAEQLAEAPGAASMMSGSNTERQKQINKSGGRDTGLTARIGNAVRDFINPPRSKSADPVVRRGGEYTAFGGGPKFPNKTSSNNANSAGQRGSNGGMTDAQIKAAQDKANADRRAGKMSDLRGTQTKTIKPEPVPVKEPVKPAKPKLSAQDQKTNAEYDRLRKKNPTTGKVEGSASDLKKAADFGKAAARAKFGDQKPKTPNPLLSRGGDDSIAAMRQRSQERQKQQTSRLDKALSGIKPGAGVPKEDVDLFDLVKGHLIDEGATAEEAMQKMISMTQEEILTLAENRRAARAAGGYKDDSKKQTDPSKEGFTGISGSIKDIMRQNKEIEARNKKK